MSYLMNKSFQILQVTNKKLQKLDLFDSLNFQEHKVISKIFPYRNLKKRIEPCDPWF